MCLERVYGGGKTKALSPSTEDLSVRCERYHTGAYKRRWRFSNRVTNRMTKEERWEDFLKEVTHECGGTGRSLPEADRWVEVSCGC